MHVQTFVIVVKLIIEKEREKKRENPDELLGSY